jgi:hypothetical protein
VVYMEYTLLNSRGKIIDTVEYQPTVGDRIKLDDTGRWYLVKEVDTKHQQALVRRTLSPY